VGKYDNKGGPNLRYHYDWDLIPEKEMWFFAWMSNDRDQPATLTSYCGWKAEDVRRMAEEAVGLKWSSIYGRPHLRGRVILCKVTPVRDAGNKRKSKCKKMPCQE
jgi:hypothetical protein